MIVVINCLHKICKIIRNQQKEKNQLYDFMFLYASLLIHLSRMWHEHLRINTTMNGGIILN